MEPKIPVNGRFVLIFLIILVILNATVFLTITGVWVAARYRSTNTIEPDLSVNCADLVGRGERIDDLHSVKGISSGSVCTGKASDILRLAARKQTIDEYYARVLHTVPSVLTLLCASYEHQTPHVQAVGISGTVPHRDGHKLLWNANGKTVTTPNILRITHLQDEGEIFIRQTGLYHVTSYLGLKSSILSYIHKPLIHYMYVLSHRYGTSRMLSERRTSLQGRNQAYSFTSAVYNLDLHDRLSVVFSHPEYIDRTNADNMFSVYLKHH